MEHLMTRVLIAITTSFLLTACEQASQSNEQLETPPWDWTESEDRDAVNQVRAGRDLTPESWPNEARVAVLFSFDVDNETVQGLRDGNVSVGPLSQGEYGARVALPRVVELMNREGIPSTFFFPAWSLKLAPSQAEVIQSSGMHEIAVHGWIHERNSELDADTEERLLVAAIEEVTELTGEKPVGYRAPSWNFSPNTLEIVLRLGFLYESSLMADDRPYELLHNGKPRGNSYSSPREVMQVWIDEFDKAWEEGTMFLLTMHPHYIGHRSRIVALEGLIEHMKSRGNVWFATHEATAHYVRDQAGMN